MTQPRLSKDTQQMSATNKTHFKRYTKDKSLLLKERSILRYSEADVRRRFAKQVLLKSSKHSQENTCVGASFNKVQVFRPATLRKRGFNTGTFL